MPKKIIKSAKKYTRSENDNEIKNKYQKKLDALEKGRGTQKTNRESVKAEKSRKKTFEEEIEEMEAIQKKRQTVSKQIFGKKKTLEKLNDNLTKRAGTMFIEVLPSQFKTFGRVNDFRIIYSQNKFSRYSKSFTRANIKTFTKHINEFLKEKGIDKGEITLNLNYNGVYRPSQFDIGETTKFYDVSDYSPSDEDLKENEYFNKIDNFDQVSFIISAKPKKIKKI